MYFYFTTQREMGFLTRAGGVALIVPGGQVFGAAAIAFSVRPPDPLEIAIAATFHVVFYSEMFTITTVL